MPGTGLGFFQRAGLVVAAMLILALTFTLGMLVGRQWARPVSQVATPEAARKGAAPVRRSGLGEVEAGRPKGLSEKLTFYQTLTAPLGPTTSHAKGKPEEKGRPEARPKPEARPAAEASPQTADMPRPVTAPGEAGGAEPRGSQVEGPGQASPAGASVWTVQVGAFKSRKQADAVQRGLSGAGFPVEISALTADDGQPRYRVRVGSFKTRSDAAQMAERLSAERSLATYVTTN